MVDKTNMSLDDIIKMDKKKGFRGKTQFLKNKNTMARNVVKKARISFINRKPPIDSKNKNLLSKKNFTIHEKRQDVRSRLLKSKQNNFTVKKFPQNNNTHLRDNSNSKFFTRQNKRSLNMTNASRLNNRVNPNVVHSAQAFRITTNNERYRSNASNERRRPMERQDYKPNTINNNKSFQNFNNNVTRNQSLQFSGGYRHSMHSNNNTNYNQYQQSSRQSDRGDVRRNHSFLSRDREYEAMARALIEAHRQNRYSTSINQPIQSSQRRYNPQMEGRGYPIYRR